MVDLTIDGADGAARAGTATTARGPYTTPLFMPVGTRAAIKYLSAADYAQVGAQIVLGNTYHLMLRPGADLVERFGGLGRFAGWDGLTLTDSGGFQVFSLDPKIDDDGVTFKSIYDGSSHRFTPEIAVDVQQRLGADIQMVLDVCPPLPSAPEVIRSAVERTQRLGAPGTCRPRAPRPVAVRHRAGRSERGDARGERPPHRGGRLRRVRHRRAVGRRDRASRCCPRSPRPSPSCPTDQPRYLMGVGDPASLVEAVALGVDQFDCVMQTRLGRHGTALTSTGRFQAKAARNAELDEPLDTECSCDVCARHSRGYLRHLLQVGEPTASRLLSIHNVAWTIQLMDRMRAAIVAGTFDRLRARRPRRLGVTHVRSRLPRRRDRGRHGPVMSRAPRWNVR